MSSLAAQTRLILHNDLRLLWRELRAGKWRLFGSGILIGVVLLVLHAISLLGFSMAKSPPPVAVETLIWAFFSFSMLGAAMTHAIGLLFERADFDLLLTAPIQPRAVLLARLASIATSSAFGVALLMVPLLNGAAFGLGPAYLAGYVTWFLCAAIAGSVAVGLTLAIVRVLGVRRARVTVQVLAALLGATVYLASQLGHLVPSEAGLGGLKRLAGVFKYPAVNVVGQAGHGDVRALAILAVIASVVVAFTTALLARVFVGGTQDAAVVEPRRKQTSHAHRWTDGLLAATFRKDLRLILRDPLLLAQILPSAVYFIPALFVFGRTSGVALLAPFSVLVATQFSMQLTHVAAAGEECWDLIRMSPSPELRLRLAKMGAGLALPVALAVVLCLILAGAGRPWIALVSLLTAVATAATCAWLAVLDIRPTPRKDVLKRGARGGPSHGIARGIVSAALMFTAAGAVGLLASGYLLLGGCLIGLVSVGIAACFTFSKLKALNPETA